MSADLAINSSIGPYRIVDCVGAGGMGTVYRVSHRATGRVAAAKVMSGGAMAPRALDRFRNEARILQALSHPAIAAMYEFLEVNGAPCLVMEYVDGETIEQLLHARGPFAVAEGVRVFATLVDAVGYVHQRGIVHRDLKTTNVKIDGDGTVKLLDFGIARADGAPRLTSTGNVVGTLMSLAPEQLRTGRAEPRSDIWALGILFYEMMTGRPPFEAGAPGLLGERILRGTYRPASELRPDLPREIDRIIGRCLRVRAEDRYASAEALLTDLRGLQSAERRVAPLVPVDLLRSSGEFATTIARNWRMAAASTAALAAVAFFVWNVVPARDDGPNRRLPADTTIDIPATGEVPVAPSGGRVVVVPPHVGPADRPVMDSATLRTLIIRVLDGPADVYIDGAYVGTTPYTLQAPLRKEMQLLLRRTGCEDTRRPLRLEEGMVETVESLTCR